MIDIDATFTYHSPKGNQPQRYEELRESAKKHARLIDALVPNCAEKTLALRFLQQCSMMSNAAIAITEAGGDGVHPRSEATAPRATDGGPGTSGRG